MISIIIITHNREPKILQRAIESVLLQDYDDKEIIIINDSPKDYKYINEVRSLIDKYINAYKDIKYIEHDKTMGACAARNTGIRESNGEYIALLDDDDEWISKKLSKQMDCFNRSSDPKLALVYCGLTFVYDNENNREEDFLLEMYKGNVFTELLGNNFIFGASFPLIRADVLKSIGGFDTEFLSCQDWDVWLRVAKNWTVDYCNEPLVRYHIHGGDQITKNFDNRINGLTQLTKKYYSDYCNNPIQYKQILNKILYQYSCKGDLYNALSIFKKIRETDVASGFELFTLRIKILKWILIKR